MKNFYLLFLFLLIFSCTKTPPFPEEFSITLENNPTTCDEIHISIDDPDQYNYRYIIHTRLMNSYIDECDGNIGEYVEYVKFEDEIPATFQTDLFFQIECPGVHEVYVIRELLSPRNNVVAPSKGRNHLFVQVDICLN